MPRTYIAATANPDIPKYPLIAVNTASRALQGQNGVTSAAFLRALRPAIPRVASTAVAEQPSPSTAENAARPVNPNRLKNPSVTNATRLMYPLSCSIAVKKYKSTTCGKNASTPPTPAAIPSASSDLTHSGAFSRDIGALSRPRRDNNSSERGFPASNVITNTATITARNIGSAALPSTMRSMRRVRSSSVRLSVTPSRSLSIYP